MLAQISLLSGTKYWGHILNLARTIKEPLKIGSLGLYLAIRNKNIIEVQRPEVPYYLKKEIEKRAGEYKE